MDEKMTEGMYGVLDIKRAAMKKTVADLKIKLADAESETDVIKYRRLIDECECKFVEFEKEVLDLLEDWTKK